ncbi:MAG TPA: porin, partial [Kofleriaceae bacterium]
IPVGTKGFLKPGVLLQGWFLTDRTAGATASTFRLRRAEIHARGEILPGRVAFHVMLDPARAREFGNTTVTDSGGDTSTIKQPSVGSNSSVFQDLEIIYLTKYADIGIGQFKIPVSWDGYNSSAKILTPERAIVAMTYGDKRDMGVKISKTMEKWGYFVGLYNGQGANNLDTNNQKDVAVRLEVYPVKGLTIAGVTYNSLFYREKAGTKDRYEADLRYEAHDFLFQGEYIHARDVGDKDAKTNAQGFYAAIAYTLKDASLGGDLQPVLRLGMYDPNTSKDLDPAMSNGSDEQWDYLVGLNYYLQGHEMKFQASYERQQYDDKAANNEIILATEVSY